jgi:hypothetical protein
MILSIFLSSLPSLSFNHVMYDPPLLLQTVRGQLLQIRFARPTMYSWAGRDAFIPLSITSHPDTIFCHLAQNQLILLD